MPQPIAPPPPIAKQVLTVSLESTPYQAAYWEQGSGSPILFLHGFMGRSESWQPLVAHLADHHRCICLDLLGCGESSKPMIRYDIAKLVAFVRGFVEAIGSHPGAIVGHSLGGWVAAAYTLNYPQSVNHLILAAPAGIRDDSFCGRYDHLRPLLWQTPGVDAALWLMQPIALLLRKNQDLQTIRWIRRELNAQPAPRSFLLDRMRPEDAIDTVEKEIHQLQIPTLVITGDCDETIPLWHSQTYADQIADAQLVILPGAAHNLPQDYAPDLATHILPFLNAQTTKSATSL
ncbi:alpha/beta fold hydrolase [Egbenema bharatensis]|uniref:alpha/beta fold hydrolase n=1 Tax=Egbenema bharatensis TaxID=3463334 RepID=UPI003A8B2A36